MGNQLSDIFRWIIDQYRTRLQDVDPEQCRRVDETMIRVGHQWVCDDTIIDPEELVTTEDIERRFGITRQTLYNLTHRHDVKAKGRLGRNNVYRLGDIISARSNNNLNRFA